jgi:hypothetical protein
MGSIMQVHVRSGVALIVNPHRVLSAPFAPLCPPSHLIRRRYKVHPRPIFFRTYHPLLPALAYR